MGAPGPRLGLDLYRAGVDWSPFIARVEEKGWCLPAKAEGLRRWPGVEWLVGGGEVRFVRQGVNHVKVVVERGARTVAKAYAGVWVCPYE